MSPRDWIDREVGVSRAASEREDPLLKWYKKLLPGPLARMGLRLDPVETATLIKEAYHSARAVMDGTWRDSGKRLPPEILELLKKFQ
jgi:hypothetical protein